MNVNLKRDTKLMKMKQLNTKSGVQQIDQLLSYTSTVGEFIESLCEKLDTITSHSSLKHKVNT